MDFHGAPQLRPGVPGAKYMHGVLRSELRRRTGQREPVDVRSPFHGGAPCALCVGITKPGTGPAGPGLRVGHPLAVHHAERAA